MTNTKSPYENQPEKAFWRISTGSRHYAEVQDLWQPIELKKSDRIATAGSCFAQHIGNNLALRGADWMNLEPAPPIFESENESRKWGYGVFSCRYGNIYTTRQLLQLFDEAFGNRKPSEPVWEKDGRFFDSLRPNIDPVGQESPEHVLSLRSLHLSAVRRLFAELDLFVFTLGLTECWELIKDGTIFPMAPGTVAGFYSPDRYALRNLTYSEVYNDLKIFWERLIAINPYAKMLLTISPVPLSATATQNHVLVATTYSKSVLRAVAGDLSETNQNIYYFPSYEIISSHPSRGMFYEPDLRNVNQCGVDFVMKHFFTGVLAHEFRLSPQLNNSSGQIDLICDEEKLDSKL
jgi:hypothetical protein